METLKDKLDADARFEANLSPFDLSIERIARSDFTRKANSERAEQERDNAQIRLDAMARDEADAMAQIRISLDMLAERHGLSNADVTNAFKGYVADMLSDLLHDKREAIKSEIEDADEIIARGDRI